MVSCRQYRCTILHRNTDDTRYIAVGQLEFVAQRGANQSMGRRSASGGRSEWANSVVTDARYFLTLGAIEPLVRDDAVQRRHGTGHECRMARCRNSYGMELLCIWKYRSLVHEPQEAVFYEEVGESFEIVVTELIDNDADD